LPPSIACSSDVRNVMRIDYWVSDIRQFPGVMLAEVGQAVSINLAMIAVICNY
jgi:hypothetical protein